MSHNTLSRAISLAWEQFEIPSLPQWDHQGPSKPKGQGDVDEAGTADWADGHRQDW